MPLELLAPGGNIKSIKAAIIAGANAIYCGLNKYNARNRAANLSLEELIGVIKLAHKNECKVFLTLNIIYIDSEFPNLISFLNKIVNTNIDGVIVQDLGLHYLLSEYFPSIKIHASTQYTTHNRGQIKFLNKLKASQVNLSRELNIHEIKTLTKTANSNNIKTEIFVHGSYCVSFSGLCYISSVHSGNSGNRGRCSQPCRDKYLKTPQGKNYPLNLKDNSSFFDIEEIANSGVSSLKIEGRIKEFEYVYTVVDSWRKQINGLINKKSFNNDSSLYKVFNRDFSNSFFKGDISKNMFIDNPRDNSIKHLSEIRIYSSEDELEKEQLKFYREKENTKVKIEKKINKLSIDKIPITITVSGVVGEKLKVSIKTPNNYFDVFSDSNLIKNISTQSLSKEILIRKFKPLNNSEYFINSLEPEKLQDDIYISFKELTSIKNKIQFILNGSKKPISPIKLPSLTKQNIPNTTPSISVLVSSKEDIGLSKEINSDIYFQLPNSFKDINEYFKLFSQNKDLIPWFPSILIGNDFDLALELLQRLKPKLIITNNTGIAFEAYKNNISWIAGPFMNITNSFSLLCLKEKFNCTGAFISNELSKDQINRIIAPKDFKLFYSIYYPIELITSRQCLFHQVSGCDKEHLDDKCLPECEKQSSITNLKGTTHFISKSEGNYNKIYNNKNYLNTNIISDLPNKFSNFLIDLSDIKTETKTDLNKKDIIKIFNDYINGNLNQDYKKLIHPTTNKQYLKGI